MNLVAMRIERRPPTDEELATLMAQCREVAELRERQLDRDGIGYDATLKAMIVKETTDAK